MFLRGRKTIRLVGSIKEKLPRDRRIMCLTIILFLLWALVGAKLFKLQILNYKTYAALAAGQQGIYQELFPNRGKIFVSDFLANKNQDGKTASLYPIVTNKEYNLVYAVPNEIADPVTTAEKLAIALGWDKEKKIENQGELTTDQAQDNQAMTEYFNRKELLATQLSKENDPYEPIQHKVDEDKVAAIKELALPGIYFAKETFRYYPEGDFASQVLGFVGFKGDELVGRYGLEEKFNQELSGQPGILNSEKDAAGRLIAIGQHQFDEAKDGSDLVLTIDHTVQFIACQKLKQAVERHGADSGSLIIIDPKTGAIIAMCNFPDFNPGEYEKTEDVNNFNNNAIFDAYEPGSVFKVITMAAALDTNKVTPETTYNDEGPLQIDRFKIDNSDGKHHGWQTMVDVLDKSLNTGAIYAVEQTGGEVFTKYVKDFGFGSLSDIDLGGERAGDISSLKKKAEIYYATASYGQGITATPLQMVTAFAAIANGGVLVKPYIVDEVIRADGKIIKTEPQTVRQVISSRTASLLSGMMTSVVNGPHGKRAGVEGYHVAGKTGTAQIPRKDAAGYEANATIGTFAGFAPATNPRFAMIVRIVRPRDVQFAESTAAPLFGDIAKFLLNYYQVPPDNMGNE